MLWPLLLQYTKPRDVVIDTSVADGSALIAAQTTGRIYIGVDQDPRSVEAAIKRWRQFTGKDALEFKSGEPFDDLSLLRQP